MRKFRTYKERGEWVEAQFIAEALGRGYTVLKPWGDSQPFDVAINFGNRIVRVQVKCTSYRVGTGYKCQIGTNYHARRYTPQMLDFFAAYVIPEQTWYIIPAWVLFNGGQRRSGAMLFPMEPANNDWYFCEIYKEGWKLLRPARTKAGEDNRQRREDTLVRRLRP
ncbi:MAG: group I intron-associated PD-(D/E)XK endonuclease [Candidatus Sulfotelmatobacter sp.]